MNKLNKIKKFLKLFNFIILIMLTTFFLSSCGGSEVSSNIESLDANYFKTGYSGLEISVEDNFPPDEMYDNSNLNIVVKLENKGAYDLSSGLVQVLGFDSAYVILYDQEGIEFPSEGYFLSGKSLENADGETERASFSGYVNPIKEGAEKQVMKYYLKASYDYTNELVEDVCVDLSSYDVYDSGCELDERKKLNGQGGPLAITEIETYTNPSENEIKFYLTVQNKGQGTADKVTLIQAKLGNDELDCEFREGEGIIFDFDKDTGQSTELECSKRVSGTSSYETTLYVEYFYSYDLLEQERITIKE
ncbi:hypothetical protein HN385_06840 [archaeon]|jgi:hypothetical protein|nr:hypothetical protein [archaeon]MBT6869179.1 hypothetical protein [archaeon]MBT7381362.1 hypothetical protein [archaeon]MBT7507941.1 hypothetical protein [archaeon]